MTCSCGAEEICEWHEVRIPRGPYGLIISLKDDYVQNNPDFIGTDAAHMEPKAEEFHIGDRVIARGHGKSNRYKSDEARGPSKSAPHWGMSGTVVARQDRLYTIRFDDGHEVGFYHNELDREDKP